MPTLLLIRHGENDFLKKNKLPGRLAGIHLNSHGQDQAQELARALSPLPIQAIYSSPLERAIETAEPLAHTLGLKLHLHPELTDTDVGHWAGRSWKTLNRTKLWKMIQETPSQFQFPGGETLVQTQSRIIRALDAIAGAHEDELVAVVFHADPIKLAVAHHIGLPLDHFQRLTVNTGSVTVLQVGRSGVKLIGMNLTPPFEFIP
jgi:probable phosphomutase (TIGR03848 family)